VTFRATKLASTPPVHLPTAKAVEDFFATDEYRDILFSGGSDVQKIDHPSETLMQIFKRESSALPGNFETGLCAEELKSVVVQIDSPVKFPGLLVSTVVTMGAQLLLLPQNGDDKAMYPEYRFVLLESNMKADGPRPLVWLFNKLTGSGDTKKGNTGDTDDVLPQPTTSSSTRTWAEPAEDNKVIFRTNSQLTTKINIPSVMMKLLPVKLEKFEEQGSASLQKVLDKDVEPALVLFHKAYTKWISN